MSKIGKVFTAMKRTMFRHSVVRCKICESDTFVKFAIPISKKTGYAIPNLEDDCPYYECRKCEFLFSTHLDSVDNTDVYDETYWNNQDPDWYGRVSEAMRLVLLANKLSGKSPDQLEILDFGCGMGAFVEVTRRNLQMQTWGTDIIPPKLGKDFFLPDPDRKFDIVIACEVIEHLPDPLKTFGQIRSWLKPDGVIAFQTAEYDPNGEGRDWWYIGPENGHISLYSRKAFDVIFKKLGGKSKIYWNNYAGVQAWQF